MSENNLGYEYKQRRKELGLTQPQLAELAKVNVNTIVKLERNSGNPTLDILIRIADILGLELTLKIKKVNTE